MTEQRKIQIPLPYTGDELLAVRAPLTTGCLTQGPKEAAFEKAFAARHQVKPAMACPSGTTGLHLCLAALGVGPGDEVIVPAFSWVSTANVVLYCGAMPVFADVSRETFSIEPAQVAARRTASTKAVIAVHLFGLSADMGDIRAAAPGIPTVENAACALGNEYNDRPVGGLGSLAPFSCHPRKSITTGQGGVVTANDDALAACVDSQRNPRASVSEEPRHIGPRPYALPEFNLRGYNYRMTDLQGGVGLVQLPKLHGFTAERAKRAEYYRHELAGISWLHTPSVPDGYSHGWQSFVTCVDPKCAPISRNAMPGRLQARRIAIRPGTHAVHMLGHYRDHLVLREDDFTAARDCDRNTMAIPLHNRMSADDYAYVVSALREIDAARR